MRGVGGERASTATPRPWGNPTIPTASRWTCRPAPNTNHGGSLRSQPRVRHLTADCMSLLDGTTASAIDPQVAKARPQTARTTHGRMHAGSRVRLAQSVPLHVPPAPASLAGESSRTCGIDHLVPEIIDHARPRAFEISVGPLRRRLAQACFRPDLQLAYSNGNTGGRTPHRALYSYHTQAVRTSPALVLRWHASHRITRRLCFADTAHGDFGFAHRGYACRIRRSTLRHPFSAATMRACAQDRAAATCSMPTAIHRTPASGMHGQHLAPRPRSALARVRVDGPRA